MIYEIAGISDSINQGDILSQCPLIYWLMERRSDGMLERRATVSHERVVVFTQSCDLANDKTTNVQVAVAHEARRLVELGLLKEHTIRDQIAVSRAHGSALRSNIFPDRLTRALRNPGRLRLGNTNLH